MLGWRESYWVGWFGGAVRGSGRFCGSADVGSGKTHWVDEMYKWCCEYEDLRVW